MQQDIQPETESGVGLKLRDNVTSLMANFSNDSLRRFLRLKRQIALNNGLAEHIRNLLKWRNSGGRLSSYRVIDAMITGPNEQYEPHATDSDMLNIYELSAIERPYSSSSVLIGTHALYLLDRQIWKASDLKDCLKGFGHSSEEIEDCLRVFFNKGLFKKRIADGQGKSDFTLDVQQPVCEALIVLIEHPAYIDNMAMVTRVAEDFLQGMIPTRTYSLEDFLPRVNTSLAFLGFLRDIETDFSTWSMERHGTDRNAFRIRFNSGNLPSIYAKAAYAYRIRLERLRATPAGLVNVMDDEKWMALLGEEVLTVPARSRNESLKAQ